MRRVDSRRRFLWMCGAVLSAPACSWGQSQSGAAAEIPPLLDHILLGCGDLQGGIEFVGKATGVRAAFGGVHPGRGTQNALLSLGERRYLEIIAPDPKQDIPDEFALRTLEHPQLVGWSAHPGDITALTQRLKASGIAFAGPRPGSRTRPDGRVLTWKTLTLDDDQRHLLPFFIEWAANSVHPSVDAPAGCRLDRFVAETPDPEALQKIAAQLSLQLPIASATRPRLLATIAGPKGHLSLSS